MLDTILSERNLPPLKSREEMISVLLDEEYGRIPKRPEKLTFEVIDKPLINKFCANKATLHKVIAKCTLNGKDFSFPFYRTLPTTPGKHPFFVHINFRPDVPDRYMPSEELIDSGFAVFSFCYTDITADNGDFTDGLAGILYPDGMRLPNDAGKIALWSWAAQRVMDYAETISDVLDLDRAVVCGHSRLGKTALLAAATDTRFAFAHSNDSGCSGAAITRAKVGEQASDICKRFPYWFCENYLKYANNEHLMPFDQHWLIACIAPRYVSIASAIEDEWADPKSEFIACKAASTAFVNGFICEDRLPTINDSFFDGDIGYQLRAGSHYFSREDWLKLIQFITKKFEDKNKI